MSISKKIFSILFILIGIILTVMFAIQLTEIFIKDNRFLFFQIILVMVWGIGAFIFWIVGLTIIKSSKRNNQK